MQRGPVKVQQNQLAYIVKRRVPSADEHPTETACSPRYAVSIRQSLRGRVAQRMTEISSETQSGPRVDCGL